MSTRNPMPTRAIRQWTPKSAGSEYNYRRRYLSVKHALCMIEQSTGGNLRECLAMLASSTHNDPILLFDGKGMIWLGGEGEIA